MTIIDGLNWCLWLVTTFEHVTFSPPLLSILVFQPTYILFHTIVTEGHYMLCSIAVDCGVANDMSKVTHVLVCIVFTPCFCFASSVCFGSFEKYLSLSGFARDWCHFPSRRQPYTSILLEQFFCEIDVCVYPPLCWLCLLSDILAPHNSNIDAHALSLLTILYCVYICRYGLH